MNGGVFQWLEGVLHVFPLSMWVSFASSGFLPCRFVDCVCVRMCVYIHMVMQTYAHGLKQAGTIWPSVLASSGRNSSFLLVPGRDGQQEPSRNVSQEEERANNISSLITSPSLLFLV